jgi:hypothetical protein
VDLGFFGHSLVAGNSLFLVGAPLCVEILCVTQPTVVHCDRASCSVSFTLGVIDRCLGFVQERSLCLIIYSFHQESDF